eukprot:1177304-Prymnesium_polylepis.1
MARRLESEKAAKEEAFKSLAHAKAAMTKEVAEALERAHLVNERDVAEAAALREVDVEVSGWLRDVCRDPRPPPPFPSSFPP